MDLIISFLPPEKHRNMDVKGTVPEVYRYVKMCEPKRLNVRGYMSCAGEEWECANEDRLATTGLG